MKKLVLLFLLGCSQQAPQTTSQDLLNNPRSIFMCVSSKKDSTRCFCCNNGGSGYCMTGNMAVYQFIRCSDAKLFGFSIVEEK